MRKQGTMIPTWDIYQWVLFGYLVISWLGVPAAAYLIGKPQKPYGPGRVVFNLVWAGAATALVASSGVLR